MLIDNQPNRIYVQVVTGGFSGCRAYRASFPSQIINWTENCNIYMLETPFPLLDHSILLQTKTIMLKSPAGQGGLDLVKNLCAIRNKYGIRLVADYDDQCISLDGKIGVDFNPMADPQKTAENDRFVREMLPLLDCVIVTNEFFANHLRKECGIDNVTVIRNAVPRYLFGKPRRPKIEKAITKPRLLLSRCPLHSMPPHKDEKGVDVPGNKGDWAGGEFAEWIIHNVEQDRMDVIQLGGPNWMLEPINNKIQIYPWLPPLRYPSFVSRIEADFTLAPLVDLPFNKFKSELAYLESAVCSEVFLGTDFTDGPYGCVHPDSKLKLGITEAELNDKMEYLCQPDKFNDIIDWQWNDIAVHGLIMESDQHMNQYCAALLGGPRNQLSYDLI